MQPTEGVKKAAENLGEHLTGETIENSPYALRMKQNTTCAKLCDALAFTKEDVALFVKRIDEDYNVNWMVCQKEGTCAPCESTAVSPCPFA